MASAQTTYAGLGLASGDSWVNSLAQPLTRSASCKPTLCSADSRGVPSRPAGGWKMMLEKSDSSSCRVEASSLADAGGRRDGGLIVAGLVVLGKLLQQRRGTARRRGKQLARAAVWAAAATAWG